jgi:hypothetical protein
MPAQKSTAKASKSSASTHKQHAKATKQSAAVHKRTATAPKQPEGFFDTVVERAQEVPGHVGHALGQVVEKATEIAGAAAEKTTTIVGQVGNKVGFGTSKKSTSTQRKRH